MGNDVSACKLQVSRVANAMLEWVSLLSHTSRSVRKERGEWMSGASDEKGDGQNNRMTVRGANLRVRPGGDKK